MKIMGIDAAFANIGLALGVMEDDVIVIKDLHLVHTEGLKRRPKGMTKSTDDLRRARECLSQVQQKIIEWQPDIIVAEVPFGSQSARASWSLGITIGVLAGIGDFIEVTPRQVKTATGEPNADKDMMIEWAMLKHPEAPWVMRKLKGNIVQVASTNEHLADAVGAIYAGIALRKSSKPRV